MSPLVCARPNVTAFTVTATVADLLKLLSVTVIVAEPAVVPGTIFNVVPLILQVATLLLELEQDNVP